MAPHYCLAPDNPDITGIGVRTSLYAQSLLIVIISSIARWHGQSPDSVAGLWRVQFYTIIAFITAGIVQRANGQLSLFHETAALHLGILTFWSAVVGMLVEPMLDTSEPTHLWNGRYGGVTYMYTSHSKTAQMLMKIGYALLAPVTCIMVLVDNCVASPDNPDSDYEHITWIFLFAARLHGAAGDNQGAFSMVNIGLPFLPMAFIALGVLLLVLFNKIMKWIWGWRGVKLLICGPILGYAIFWVEEIVAVEMSLKANPGLDQGVENAWQFGQIIPLILLIPYLEILKEQLTGDRSDTDVDSTAMSRSSTSMHSHHEMTTASQA